MIPINQITSFPNHPFKVRDDEKMMETVESVKKRGVIFPAIVRKKKDGTYEMVAGHRRRRACQLAQLSEMPCIVRELTDDEATILMVDSNVQREEILPSERAWAFKMKLEALNRQGKRVDLTSTPSVQKLSVEIVAEEFGISREQVRRYVALTNLDSALLKMVDENKIALRPAVQISYMKKQDQKELLDAIESFDATPSEKQAKLLRDLSEKGILDRDKIDEIMAEEKKKEEKPVLIDTQDLDNLIEKPPVIKNIRINRAKIIQKAVDETEIDEAVDNPTEQIRGAGDVDEADAKEPETLMTPVVPTEKPEEESSSTGTTVELTGGMSVIKDQTPEEEKKPAPGIPKAMPYIIRVNTKERVMVNKAVFKLGKANRGVDFRIDGNGAISRVHAIIYQRDDGCYLKDNKATNATLVDGVKLEEGQEVKLKNDAMITIGGEDFIFKLS